MFEFFRPKSSDPLHVQTRLSTADYLCRLMEEQNAILREMVLALGRQPHAIKASPLTTGRIRTDKDVIRVTRNDVIGQEIEKATATEAQWRSGPDSAPTASTSGHTGNGKA